jgi:hypothetical protein
LDGVATGAGFTLDNYAPARLLDQDSDWDLNYSNTLFDQAGNFTTFKLDPTTDYQNLTSVEIQGRYTAGLTREADDSGLLCGGAIPPTVPQFVTVTNATSGMVNDPASYVGGVAPSLGQSPDLVVDGDFELDITDFYRFRRVTINSDATLTVTGAGVNLGTVGGEGTLKLVDNPNFPAGDFDDYFPDSNCNGGGGLEYEVTAGNQTVLSGPITTIRRVILSGDGIKETPNGVNIEICEDLILRDNGTFSLSDNARFDINGDIIKDATSIFDGDYNNAEILLSGTSQQSIDGDFTGTQAIHSLELDNSAGLTIINGANNDVEIEDELAITNGRIRTNADNSLIMKNGSSITAFSSSNYVVGPLIRQLSASTGTFFFPVGVNSRYGLMAVVAPSVTGTKDFTVNYFNTTPENDPLIGADVGNFSPGATAAGVETVSGNEYWSIDVPSPASSNVRLFWDDQSDVQSTISNLRMVQWDDGNSYWNLLGTIVAPTGSVNTGSLTSGSLNYSTQLVTLASVDASTTPLPVTLVEFKGSAESDHILLEWTTSTEIDNDYFEIQHSRDGENFEIIGLVEGNGNTNELIDYDYHHFSPYFGVNYYRFRQVDFDGKFEYSPIIRVDYDQKTNVSLMLYPNPVIENTVNVKLQGYVDNVNGVYLIHDISGRIVLQGKLESRDFKVDVSGLNSGQYFFKAHLGDKYYNFKLLKE